MIHTYQLNGFNMVIDAASGAVHSVDEVAYDTISMLDEAVSSSEGGAADVFACDEILADAAARTAQKHGISEEDAKETVDDIA